MATALPVPTIAASPTIKRGAYTWAVAIAHAKSQISGPVIMDRIGVSEDMANQILRKLMRNGVVSAPNAAGTSVLSPSLQRISSVTVHGGVSHALPGRTTVARSPDGVSMRDLIGPEQDGLTEPPDAPEVILSDDDPELPEVSGGAR